MLPNVFLSCNTAGVLPKVRRVDRICCLATRGRGILPILGLRYLFKLHRRSGVGSHIGIFSQDASDLKHTFFLHLGHGDLKSPKPPWLHACQVPLLSAFQVQMDASLANTWSLTTLQVSDTQHYLVASDHWRVIPYSRRSGKPNREFL